MSNTSTPLPVVNSEWLQPETFEKILRSVPSVLSSLSKLKTMLPKRAGLKRDPRKLGAEIDELRKDLEKVCHVLTQANLQNTKLAQAVADFVSKGGTLHKLVPGIIGTGENVGKLVTMVLAHEERLKALEASIAAGTGKRGSGKKSPAPIGAKAHRKPRVKRVK